MQRSPNELVSEVPDEGEHNRMSEGDGCLGSSGWKGEEDSWSEDEEERSDVQ
jgi:hypothetical protein